MLDELLLRKLYLDEQHTIMEITQVTGLAQSTIYRTLMHYRIPRRSPGYRRPRTSFRTSIDGLDEVTLRQAYLEEGRSIQEIATALQCSTVSVRSALIRWAIPRRNRGRP